MLPGIRDKTLYVRRDWGEWLTSADTYAVSVSNGGSKLLLCRLRRAPTGIYFLIPLEDPRRDVHASYHVDGKRHVKSYGGKMFVTQCQRLDGPWRGAESLFALAIQPGEEARLTIACQPATFAGVLDIPYNTFSPGHHHTLTVDLVEPGHAALPGPWREIVWQATVNDAVPWLLVTLWRGLAP